MHADRQARSAADLATEASGLPVGLGIITMTFFPFTLPGLLLVLPFVLPLVPLLLVGGIVYLLARAILVPVRLLSRQRPGSAERAGHDARGHAVVEGGHG